MRVPGDKSISHRYAMLAAIADGVSTIEGFAPGADCASTLRCLEALGVRIDRTGQPGAPLLHIDGRGLGGLRPSSRPLDAANSGTTMRLLAGLAAAHPFRTTIEGDASLSRRPMQRVIAPLTRMGATMASSTGRPPLVIDGAPLRGITYSPDVPSAQVKSAVLLAGLHADGDTTVVERTLTRDHTERALEAFGAPARRDGSSVTITGGVRLRAADLRVPGDISSAVFWLVLAAGTPGTTLTIEDVGLNPSRCGVFDVLRRAGADIEVTTLDERAGEPVGVVRVRGGAPRSFAIGPAEVPGVIDEIPALAALAAMSRDATITVRGAAELRVKESDRIAMLARGFASIGLDVREYEDGFTLGGGPPSGGEADAAGDHRLAMAFAVAGTAAREPVVVAGAEAVAVSYPAFFEELRRLTRER